MAHNYDRKPLQRSASLPVSELLCGCYRTLDIQSHRCLQCIIRVMLAWARDTTDFRPSMNGVGSAFASGRTVRESSREPWRDGAGSLPDLRNSAPSSFARILVWARDATGFRPSMNGGATVPVAAQRLRACWRAMAHRRRRFALLAIPLTPMLAHIWTRGDRRDLARGGLLCHFTHNVHLNGQDQVSAMSSELPSHLGIRV